MKPTRSVSLAAVSLLVAQALLPAHISVDSAHASTRPRYGGTLRVEIGARVSSLDPAESPADWREATAKQRLLELAFDPLVRLDERGQPQPALAVTWKSDAASKRWEFRLRPNVKFHDGTPLAPADVAETLAKENDRWRISALGDFVVIQVNVEHPNFPAELSTVFVSRPAADGAISGTGAFRVANWQPGTRATFSANEDYWEGRPFVDSIEVTMGRAPREQLLDFELGKADLVELAPDQLRVLAQSGKKTWSSAPVEFYFLSTSSLPVDPLSYSSSDFRDALAASIDRAAIHNVLLQRQGEIAGGCLPQWLSGYSFLFSPERNVDDARRFRAKLPANLPPLVLAYDADDALGRAIAERVALNAREIGVTLLVKPRSAMEKDAHPEVELLRRRAALPHPALAMEMVCPSTHWGYSEVQAGDVQQLYQLEMQAREQAPYRVPLFYLPESFAVCARVKNWMPYRWGQWRLANVWLAPDATSTAHAAPQGPEKP